MLEAIINTWQLSVALITGFIPVVTICWRKVSIAQHDGERIVDVIEAASALLTLVFTAWALHRYMHQDARSTVATLIFSVVVAAIAAATCAVVLAFLRAQRERAKRAQAQSTGVYS